MKSRFASLFLAAGACLLTLSPVSAAETAAPQAGSVSQAKAPVVASVNVTLMEFTVPEKLVAELVLPAVSSPESSAVTSPKLFDALVKAVRSGEASLQVANGDFLSGSPGMLTSSSLYRYPAGYLSLNSQQSGVKTMDLSPQRYADQELGLVLEVTPRLDELDGRRVVLDLKSRRSSLLRAPGVELEPVTNYPAPPVFGICDITTKATVTRGEPKLLGIFPPAPDVKDAGTTVVFVIAK